MEDRASLATSPEDAANNPPETSSTHQDCVICFDTLPPHNSARAEPCRHCAYHSHCLLQWLELSPTCPLCKTPVQRVRHGPDATLVFSAPARSAKPPTAAAAAAAPAPSSPSWITWPARTNSPSAPHPRRHPRRRHPRSNPPESPAFPARRLDVYRHGLFSLHIGANKHSRYRPVITPHAFTHDPDLQSRARAFIRRELLVLDALEPPPTPVPVAAAATGTTEISGPYGHRSRDHLSPHRLSTYKLEYIMCVLRAADMQAASGAAEILVRRHLGDHTLLFLHELRSFLRSPYRRLEEWDARVEYGPPTRG